MNQLQVFSNPEFGEVRTISEDGKVLFCGKDVAAALGYSNTRDAINRHCKGVVKRDILSQGGKQSMSFIPEGDIYRLAAKSKLPGAEKFERWVFDEVLPTIRQTGAYMTPETIEKVLLNPDTIINLAQRIKALQSENKRLLELGEKQEQVIGELKPKADYVDYILSSVGTLAIGQIAADYGLTANRLNKILLEERIQHKSGGQWILNREHMNKGYTQSKTIPIIRSDGRPDTKLFTKWTQKGRLMINDLLNERGIYANMDCAASA